MTSQAVERTRHLQVAILLITAFMVISVAVFCIVLSYHGLYELALTEGPNGAAKYAWMWPIVPDGLLIVGSTAVLYDEVTGHEDEIWKAWLMVAAGTVISIAAQASMAGEMSIGGLLVAGSPPTVLAIVWAFLMRMVRRAVKPAERPRLTGQASKRTPGV